ncbi:MAG: hypothetical protein IKY37_00090 [Bacteroidaceae bacterium]|nr:hypothetical protein [Bacteroidaceae bacterium]
MLWVTHLCCYLVNPGGRVLPPAPPNPGGLALPPLNPGGLNAGGRGAIDGRGLNIGGEGGKGALMVG